MSRRMRRPVTPVMSLTTNGQLDVHLHQGLLHALHERAGTLDQRRPVPEIAAQGDDAVGGPEAAAQAAPGCAGRAAIRSRETSLLRPGRFLTWRALTRITWKPRASRISKIGNPIDAGGFHRHVRDAAGRQPVGQAVQIAGEGRERPHRRGVAIGRHGDEVLGRAAVDPGGVRVEPFEGRGRVTGLRGAATALALHGGLL